MAQFSSAYQDQSFKIQKRNFHLELDTNSPLAIQKQVAKSVGFGQSKVKPYRNCIKE